MDNGRPTTFAEAYAGVLPDHPLFTVCQDCSEITEDGQNLLAATVQLADVVAANIALWDTPPEVTDFLLSVLVSGATFNLTARKKSNSGAQHAIEIMPQVRAMLEALAARIPGEINRIERGALTLMKEGTAGNA